MLWDTLIAISRGWIVWILGHRDCVHLLRSPLLLCVCLQSPYSQKSPHLTSVCSPTTPVNPQSPPSPAKTLKDLVLLKFCHSQCQSSALLWLKGGLQQSSLLVFLRPWRGTNGHRLLSHMIVLWNISEKYLANLWELHPQVINYIILNKERCPFLIMISVCSHILHPSRPPVDGMSTRS